MKRYALHHKDAPPDGRQCSAEMFEIAKGAYVLYSDHARVVEAADRMREFRFPTHPADLSNGAIKDEWSKLCTAYDAAKKGGVG